MKQVINITSNKALGNTAISSNKVLMTYWQFRHTYVVHIPQVGFLHLMQTEDVKLRLHFFLFGILFAFSIFPKLRRLLGVVVPLLSDESQILSIVQITHVKTVALKWNFRFSSYK